MRKICIKRKVGSIKDRIEAKRSDEHPYIIKTNIMCVATCDGVEPRSIKVEN